MAKSEQEATSTEQKEKNGETKIEKEDGDDDKKEVDKERRKSRRGKSHRRRKSEMNSLKRKKRKSSMTPASEGSMKESSTSTPLSARKNHDDESTSQLSPNQKKDIKKASPRNTELSSSTDGEKLTKEHRKKCSTISSEKPIVEIRKREGINFKFRSSSQNYKHSRLLRCVRASSPFEGAGDGELSKIKEGDYITLRGLPSAGWCEGEIEGGEIGWFPVRISDELMKEFPSHEVFFYFFFFL